MSQPLVRAAGRSVPVDSSAPGNSPSSRWCPTSTRCECFLGGTLCRDFHFGFLNELGAQGTVRRVAPQQLASWARQHRVGLSSEPRSWRDALSACFVDTLTFSLPARRIYLYVFIEGNYFLAPCWACWVISSRGRAHGCLSHLEQK